MKRRGFLTLLGAAVAAPFVPAPLAARSAAYSRAALHGAIYHAQSRAVFSVWGLSKTLGISTDAASALMQELSQRGVIGPLQGATASGRWATSRLWRAPAASATHITRRDLTRHNLTTQQPDLMTYLRRLAAREGFTIQPRALAA